jgi:hypothetical protein
MKLLGNSNSQVIYRLFQPTFYQSLNKKNFIYFGSFFYSTIKAFNYLPETLKLLPPLQQ